MKSRGDGQPFEIDTVRLSADQLSFAIAGTAADQHDRALYQLFGKLYGGLAQRFIAPDDQRVIHASFFQPLLDDMRTLAAASAAQVAFWITRAGLFPGGEAAGANLTIHQLMAQCESGFRPLTLIAGTDGSALVIVHQRQVDRCGHGALPEFNRGTDVNQRRIAGKNLPNILWD